ncbi:MAG: PaaI family thioesterase [Limisphaerales bacterium]
MKSKPRVHGPEADLDSPFARTISGVGAVDQHNSSSDNGWLGKPNMTKPTGFSQTRLETTRAKAHPFCLVCSQSNALGLGLKFTVHNDGSVSASFLGHSALEGFPGFLHGGMIALLLDGALTNCLFARGQVAMTGELKVRYRKPVMIGREVFIRAWILQSLSPFHLLAAELKQGGCIKATASAKFVERNGGDNCLHQSGRE